MINRLPALEGRTAPPARAGWPTPVARLHPSLPIFGLSVGPHAAVYVPPGRFAIVSPARLAALARRWSATGAPVAEPGDGAAIVAIEQWAAEANRRWEGRLERPFEPVCLTVHVGGPCNLRCEYCHARPRGAPSPARRRPRLVGQPTLQAAAELVGEHCRRRGLPFQLVVHGDGEPSLPPGFVERCVGCTREVATRLGLTWCGYIATNGVMPEARARWLGEHFDVVGLSCDGPPDIQDRRRPRRGGGPSSPLVERTARAVLQAGGRLESRATIAPADVARQTEIAGYLLERLGIGRLRFEPAYFTGWPVAEAEAFVAHFLAAQAWASAHGGDLSFTGVRLEELHGPFCEGMRDVLRLTADGSAAACFLGVEMSRAPPGSRRLGGFDARGGAFHHDADGARAARRMALEIPPECLSCMNLYHCARGCPERCALDERAAGAIRGTGAEFRCEVHRRLSEAWLRRAVLSTVTDRPSASRSASPADDDQRLAALRGSGLSEADEAFVRRQWRTAVALFGARAEPMPAPPWAERGFDHRGQDAFTHLAALLSSVPRPGPISVYVHVPFCVVRCGFCDCYSVPLAVPDGRRELGFLRGLLAEIDVWARLPGVGRRPVTTVHFGGGTPVSIGGAALGTLVERCQTRLGVTTRTQWAVETTASRLTGGDLAQLSRWGFARIHVGVQTLEDPVRRAIGRRTDGATVLARLSAAVRHGFIVSVDVVYGLPGETLGGFVETLRRLVAAGVDGISVYRFNRSPRNREFLRASASASPEPLECLLSFLAADRLLLGAGFRKNHFAHFARPRDDNLYFTHSARGEDLLAMGPTADGVFGQYLYRHGSLPAYLGHRDPTSVPLEGGGERREPERGLQAIIAGLLCARVEPDAVRAVAGDGLLQHWRVAGLLEAGGPVDTVGLSASGSYYLRRMIGELTRSARSPLASEGRAS